MYDHVDKIDPARQNALKQEAIEKAKAADLIIFIGGMNKNHRQDCENGDRESYDLSFGQNELISELARIQKNIVVVTFGGNPYSMPWLDQVQALVHCWYLGSEAGTALANVLTGKVCPSGKLPVTFARHYEDYPYVKYGKEAYPGVDKQVYYKEGVFMGYRGFDRNKTKALFPFGFGLSYTTFKYGKPAIVKNGEGWTVTVDVTNTGDREGKETVQLYIGEVKPAVERPAKELKNFAKLALKPGETKTAAFQITSEDLKYWDETAHGWKTAPGKYRAYVAASSADIRGTVGFEL
jgi:beta-glucosidase